MPVRDLPKLAYTPAEAADLLGVTRQHLYRFLNSGELPSFYLGRSRRIPAIALERFVAERAGLLEPAKGDE